MTMFTQEMLLIAGVDGELASHMKAFVAAYAATAFEASVVEATETKAKAQVEAQAKAEAKAEAEAEAKAQAEFLKTYPKGYVYLTTADEANSLVNAAMKVGLQARTFIEEVVDTAYIKVVFMRPKKGGKRG